MALILDLPITDSGLGASRAWYKGLPSAMDPDYIIRYHDFLNTTVLDANEFVAVKDASATNAVVANSVNGELKLTSNATTDNDGACVQSIYASHKLDAGKQCWFETSIQGSSVADMDIYVGLAALVATNPENVLTSVSRCGFQVDDGSAVVNCITTNTTETKTSSQISMVDNTYMKLGFRWDGVNRVEFYVNRVLVAVHTTNVPTAAMHLSVFELSGSATGTRSLLCDYLWLAKER